MADESIPHELKGAATRKIEAPPMLKSGLPSPVAPAPIRIPEGGVAGKLAELRNKLAGLFGKPLVETRGPVTTEVLFGSLGYSSAHLIDMAGDRSSFSENPIKSKQLVKMFSMIREGHGDPAAANFAQMVMESYTFAPSPFAEHVKNLEKNNWENRHGEQRRITDIHSWQWGTNLGSQRNRQETLLTKEQFKMSLDRQRFQIPEPKEWGYQSEKD